MSDIVTALRARAEQTHKSLQLMASAKTARNADEAALYDAGRIEDTMEWKAADEIERLRAAVAAEREACKEIAEAEAAQQFGHSVAGEEVADAIAAAIAARGTT